MDRYQKAMQGELEFLRNDRNIGTPEFDEIALNELEEDYYHKIGFGEKFERLHELRTQKALLEADFIINDKRFNLNLIRIKESEIKSIEDQMNSGSDIMSAKVALEKWLKRYIDFKVETVMDFHANLKEYGRA